MGIAENDTVVAKIIANDSRVVRPLAIRVKDFNVRGLAQGEVEVALERLKQKGVISQYHHRWGFFIKNKGQKYLAFEETGTEPLHDDDGQAGTEEEVYTIDANSSPLAKYLENNHGNLVVTRTITKKGEDFYIADSKINFTAKDSIHYRLFAILYGEDGESRLLPYETLDKELVRLGEEKLTEWARSLRRIQNAVNNGLYHRISKKLEQHVRIRARQGVEFLNPPRT